MKKGISPLIATVLLIGFVVAIGAIVMLWGKGFVTERAEKSGELSKAQLDCTQVNLKFLNLVSGRVTFENRGTVDINAFKVKYYGVSADVKDFEDIYAEVPPLGRIEIPGKGANSIDVIPSIKPKGFGAPLVPCSDKHKKVNL